jgi:His/Glu/Gln/Arg/opine family amino acid ABC transporter permease subunit
MDWHVLWGYREALWHAFALTSIISLLAIAGSLTVGTCAGCIGALPQGLAPRLVAAYVELMRNIPAVILLFFLYFVVGMNAIAAGVLGLTLHHSAYIADVTSAGFRSISREQVEAGIACGHSYPQIFRYILIPQAIRIVLPSMTSQFVAVVKNSAICMLLGIEDLTWQTQEIASSTFRGFEAATAVTVLYLAISMIIVLGMSLLDSYLLKPAQPQ